MIPTSAKRVDLSQTPMSAAHDDYERRSAQLATILERQEGVRTRIAASDDLDEQMRLEELLEDLLQKADRLKNLTKSAHARIAQVHSLEDNVDLKPTPGILTPAPTPARPRKSKGGSEDEAMVSTSDTSDKASKYRLGSPVGPVGPIGPVKRITQSPEKKLNQQGTPTIPKPERVEIDLTLDSDDEVEPQAPPILLRTPRRPPPASQAPSSSPRRSPPPSSPRNAPVVSALHVPEEDVKPLIELDVVEPRAANGVNRMVGEERVRRLLFRVKQENEGGQLELDESCKLCLGEDLTVPEGQRCTASREAIMHLFGGTTQQTYPHVKKDVRFARIKKGDDLICANFSFNPDMPKEPGEHGIMMSELNWFKKGDQCATFVGVDKHEWLYVGDYVVFGQAALPVPVWNGLADGTKKTWAKNIVVKEWGKSWLTRCELPADQHTEAGVMAAFASGELTMSISILQCIGYDPAIVAAVGEAQKGWLNGTVGSAKLHAKGAARKWLLTAPGERWRNETKAGREWSQQDPLGRRYATLRTRDEKKQWAAERMSREWRNAYLGLAGAGKKRKKAAPAARKSKGRPAKRRRVETKSAVSDSDEEDDDDDRREESSRAAVTRSTRSRRTTKAVVAAVDPDESDSEYEEEEVVDELASESDDDPF